MAKKKTKKRLPKTVKIAVPLILDVGLMLRRPKLVVSVQEGHAKYDSWLVNGTKRDKALMTANLLMDLPYDHGATRSVVWLEATVKVPNPLEPTTVQAKVSKARTKKVKKKGAKKKGPRYPP